MPLTDRFQLFDLKRDEGARTFEAREIATSRPVLVHVFSDRTSPLNRVLLAKLDALPDQERSRVIDRGDHEGGVYVVTDRLAEYSGLWDWLSQKDPRPRSLDSASAWQTMPALKVSVDDQLANLFDTAPLPVLEPSPTAPAPAPVLTDTGQHTLEIPKPVAPVAPAPPPPSSPPSFIKPPTPAPAANDPGEFTRQFAPVLRPAPPPSQPAPPPAQPTPPSSASNEPGEFTRQFAPVLRPAAPASQATPPPPASNEPGEFTRQFAPVLRPAAPPVQPAPPPPASNEPGEFTRQFAPVLRPAAPPAQSPAGEFTSQFPAAPAKPDQPGEFTRQFQAPQRPVIATPSQPRTQAPSLRSTQQQDGEFTQMLRAQGPPAPTPPISKPAEFDDYFQSPPVPLGSTQQFRPMTPPSAPPMRPGRGGEFTQVFGPGDLAPPAPPAPASPSAGATQAFRPPAPTPPSGVSFPPPSPPQGFAPRPAPGLRQGSDDWDNMFDKPASLTFGQANPAPQVARMPEAATTNLKRNNLPMPLLLIVGAVVLLLVAVIVYLVMRQH